MTLLAQIKQTLGDLPELAPQWQGHSDPFQKHEITARSDSCSLRAVITVNARNRGYLEHRKRHFSPSLV